MNYDFSNLAPADFEDLVRDLIGRELDMRFEAFGAGPDGGMDGRHAQGRAATILQAKHYARSTFRNLLAAMKHERSAIDRLVASRYLLATSRSLTAGNKGSLEAVIDPALKNQSDIFSADDLNGLLRKYPDIEKAHIKLWLSSTVVLERVTRAAAHAYAAITMDEMLLKCASTHPIPVSVLPGILSNHSMSSSSPGRPASEKRPWPRCSLTPISVRAGNLCLSAASTMDLLPSSM